MCQGEDSLLTFIWAIFFSLPPQNFLNFSFHSFVALMRRIFTGCCITFDNSDKKSKCNLREIINNRWLSPIVYRFHLPLLFLCHNFEPSFKGASKARHSSEHCDLVVHLLWQSTCLHVNVWISLTSQLIRLTLLTQEQRQKSTLWVTTVGSSYSQSNFRSAFCRRCQEWSYNPKRPA